MYTLQVKNKNGQILNLTQNENKYQIRKIDGLTPPKGEIHTIDTANLDGSKYKSSRLDVRNLVLTIKINGEVEKNRIALYDFFRPSQWCSIIYKNGTRNVQIECYCETMESELFSLGQVAQISLLCPSPHWVNLYSTIVDISKRYGNFQFPFSLDDMGMPFAAVDLNKVTRVVNYGEVANGIKITIKANDTVSNPVIYNYYTGEFIKVNITMNKGEVLLIDTLNKKVTSIIDSIERNAINLKDNDSTWLKLAIGNNFFTYNADEYSEQLDVVIEHSSLYYGV